MAIRIRQHIKNKLPENGLQNYIHRNMTNKSELNNYLSTGIYFITDIYDVMDGNSDFFEPNPLGRRTSENIPLQLYAGRTRDSEYSLGNISKYFEFNNNPLGSKYRIAPELIDIYKIDNLRNISTFASLYNANYDHIYHPMTKWLSDTYMSYGSTRGAINDIFKVNFSGSSSTNNHTIQDMVPGILFSNSLGSSSYRMANNPLLEGMIDFPPYEGENIDYLNIFDNMKFPVGDEYEYGLFKDDFAFKSGNIKYFHPNRSNDGYSMPLHLNRNVLHYTAYKKDKNNSDTNYVEKGGHIYDTDKFPVSNVSPSKNYFPTIFSNDPIYQSKSQGRYLLNDYIYSSSPNIKFDTKTDYNNDLTYVAKFKDHSIMDIPNRFVNSAESHNDMFSRLGVLIVQATETMVLQKFINREYIFYRIGYIKKVYKEGNKWVDFTSWKMNIPNNTRYKGKEERKDNEYYYDIDQLSHITDSLHYPLGYGSYRNNGHYNSIKGKTYNFYDIRDLINSYGHPLSKWKNLDDTIKEYLKGAIRKGDEQRVFIKITGDRGLTNFVSNGKDLLLYGVNTNDSYHTSRNTASITFAKYNNGINDNLVKKNLVINTTLKNKFNADVDLRMIGKEVDYNIVSLGHEEGKNVWGMENKYIESKYELLTKYKDIIEYKRPASLDGSYSGGSRSYSMEDFYPNDVVPVKNSRSNYYNLTEEFPGEKYKHNSEVPRISFLHGSKQYENGRYFKVLINNDQRIWSIRTDKFINPSTNLEEEIDWTHGIVYIGYAPTGASGEAQKNVLQKEFMIRKLDNFMYNAFLERDRNGCHILDTFEGDYRNNKSVSAGSTQKDELDGCEFIVRYIYSQNLLECSRLQKYTTSMYYSNKKHKDNIQKIFFVKIALHCSNGSVVEVRPVVNETTYNGESYRSMYFMSGYTSNY